MEKILVSLPEHLVSRMKAVIPARKRSKILAQLLEKEVKRREKALYQCALEVEKDDALNKDMEEWNSTTGDGIESESW